MSEPPPKIAKTRGNGVDPATRTRKVQARSLVKELMDIRRTLPRTINGVAVEILDAGRGGFQPLLYDGGTVRTMGEFPSESASGGDNPAPDITTDRRYIIATQGPRALVWAVPVDNPEWFADVKETYGVDLAHVPKFAHGHGGGAPNWSIATVDRIYPLCERDERVWQHAMERVPTYVSQMIENAPEKRRGWMKGAMMKAIENHMYCRCGLD